MGGPRKICVWNMTDELLYEAKVVSQASGQEQNRQTVLLIEHGLNADIKTQAQMYQEHDSQASGEGQHIFQDPDMCHERDRRTCSIWDNRHVS